jgi:hypothetical protein
MATNKTKIDRIHELLPAFYRSKNNDNWKALVEAIGESDQSTADLIEEVRKQFFVKTSSRPYLDRLAANYKVSRPRFVGMSDSSFRQYIPILAYNPKQVKLIIDQLLDIFFFKESTTAFITSQNSENFVLQNGWELEYLVDGQFDERISFKTADFTSIGNATADEIVASINRQAKYSYATAYFDSLSQRTFVRVFSNTIGSKGSLQIAGGRANIAFQFNGFVSNAGNGSNTQWTVTKVGDTTSFQYVGGTSPGLDALQVGDIFVSNLPGNSGSFAITSIDLPNNTFSFVNLFSTAGTFSQISDNDTKYIRPNKYVAYTSNRRAITWETTPGEITVEMPTSPPVVQRSLKGSFHINGALSIMTARNSDTSLTLADASPFPESGTFWIEPVDKITNRIVTEDLNEVVSKTLNGRLIGSPQRYSYTSRLVLTTTGDIASGSTQITNLASVVGLAPGQTVFCDGVRADAQIVSVVGSTVNMSVAATQTSSGLTVKFGGNTLTGVSPNLPQASGLNEFSASSLLRSGNTVTITTSSATDLAVGDRFNLVGSSGISSLTTLGDVTLSSNVITNLVSIAGLAPGQSITGAGIPANAKIISILSPTSVLISKVATATALSNSLFFREITDGSFIVKTKPASNILTYDHIGINGAASTAGTVTVERLQLSPSGSRVILTEAVSADDTRIIGPYIWDAGAPFVLSSEVGKVDNAIQAGKIVRVMEISADNSISNEPGFIVLDYGKENQEGPIRYLFKPSSDTIAIDPSYVFQKSHSANASIVRIRKKGPHTLDGKAGEYAPYVTDPSEARIILQELIRSVKSAGIFINFLIRYPNQLYATLDVYQSGIDPDA